jgi:hypothetical protein
MSYWPFRTRANSRSKFEQEKENRAGEVPTRTTTRPMHQKKHPAERLAGCPFTKGSLRTVAKLSDHFAIWIVTGATDEEDVVAADVVGATAERVTKGAVALALDEEPVGAVADILMHLPDLHWLPVHSCVLGVCAVGAGFVVKLPWGDVGASAGAGAVTLTLLPALTDAVLCANAEDANIKEKNETAIIFFIECRI